MADLPGAVDLADLGDFAYLAGARLHLTSFQPPADFEDLADFVDWGANFLEQEDFTGVEGAEHLTHFLGGFDGLVGELVTTSEYRGTDKIDVSGTGAHDLPSVQKQGLPTMMGRTSDG